MTETVPRIPLQSWIEDHISRIPDRMLWRWAAVDQIGYLCELASLVNVSPGERHAIGPVGAYVIATHRSKSIELPVVSLERPDLGIQFVLCNNFYHTKLSVISERPLVDEAFPYLFHTQPPPDPTRAASDPLSHVYFEGFPPNLIFGYHAENPRRWSAEFHDRHAVWTTLFLCLRLLSGLVPRTFSAQASPTQATEGMP